MRENAVPDDDVAAHLTEHGGNSPGAIEVPKHCSLLTGVEISVAPDWTADAQYGFSSAIEIKGLGTKFNAPGPCGGTCGIATGSAGFSAARPQRYKCRIPVGKVASISIDGWLHGEDCGELHMQVELEFDGVPGQMVAMDYREENLTAANTPVTLGATLGAAEAYIQPITPNIGEIHVNGGLKGVAGPLAAPTVVQLFGGGLDLFNNDFNGHAYATQDDIETVAKGGAGSVQTVSIQHMTPGLKVTGKFQAQGIMLEDDVGTIFQIIGIGYV